MRQSGNVCVLRSGREAIRTSTAIVAALKRGIRQAGANPDIVNILEDTSHESANVLMTADGLVDLLIPRGGAGLIRACVEHATVPASRLVPVSAMYMWTNTPIWTWP